MVVLNLAPQDRETEGLPPSAHLEVLADHAPGLRWTWCWPTAGSPPAARPTWTKAAGLLGARLLFADVAMRDGSPRHDPARLAGVYAQIFEGE